MLKLQTIRVVLALNNFKYLVKVHHHLQVVVSYVLVMVVGMVMNMVGLYHNRFLGLEQLEQL